MRLLQHNFIVDRLLFYNIEATEGQTFSNSTVWFEHSSGVKRAYIFPSFTYTSSTVAVVV